MNRLTSVPDGAKLWPASGEGANLVSTVTVSTVSTISTVSTVGLAVAVGVVGAVALIGLLATKEMATAHGSVRGRLIARFCDVGVWPLLAAFAVTVALKVAEVLT